jgi:CheY-like chemotaxis protein
MGKPFILMLEADEDDQYITQSLFEENNIPVDLKFTRSSDEFLSYLENCTANNAALPSLMIMDVNAVPLSGVEVLKKLKTDILYNHIPVVILSEAANSRVVKECYVLGASSFIIKPNSNEATRKKILNFLKYWFETVELV